MSQTLRNIFEDALQLLDIENASVSAVDIRDFVIRAINAALQKMQLGGPDYFTREKETISLVAGTASYALPADVLCVLMPARLIDGTPLRELTTRGELDLFSQLYLGSVYQDAAEAKPMAILIERARTSGSNPLTTTVSFAPTPDVAYTAEVSVSRVPPVYVLSQVTEPSPIVPVPHEFTESILLPLVRWEMRLSRLFRKKDLIPVMEKDYMAAMDQLGLADPQVRATGASTDVLDRAKRNARAAAKAAYQQTLAAK